MSQTDQSLRPVVAIDIDGVLRIYEGERIDGAFSAEVTFREDDYPELFHGRPPFVDGVFSGTDWFSGVGAAWVRDLLDRNIEVVLATTWQGWANIYFAEILGIPQLPVAVKSTGDDWWHCSPAWKSHQLSRQFDGRPLIWVDDNPVDRPGEYLTDLRLPKDRALTAFHKVFFVTGIQDVDVVEIDEWLALASTADGQVKLRTDRRRRKARDAYRRRNWQRRMDARFAAHRSQFSGEFGDDIDG